MLNIPLLSSRAGTLIIEPTSGSDYGSGYHADQHEAKLAQKCAA